MSRFVLTTLAACAVAEHTEDGLSLLQVHAHRQQQEPCDICASVPDTEFSEDAHKSCAKVLVRVGKGSEKRQAKVCAKMGGKAKVTDKCCVSTATTTTTTTTTEDPTIYSLADHQYAKCYPVVQTQEQCEAAAAQLGKKFSAGSYTQTAGCYGYPTGAYAGTVWFSTNTNAAEKDPYKTKTADQRRMCADQPRSLLQVNDQQEPCDLCAAVADTEFSEDAHKMCAKVAVRVGKGSEKRQAKVCAKMAGKSKVQEKCCVSTVVPTTTTTTSTTTEDPTIYSLADHQFAKCYPVVDGQEQCEAAAAQMGKKFSAGSYTQTIGCYGYPTGAYAGTLWFSTNANAAEKSIYKTKTADQRRVCADQPRT